MAAALLRKSGEPKKIICYVTPHSYLHADVTAKAKLLEDDISVEMTSLKKLHNLDTKFDLIIIDEYYYCLQLYKQQKFDGT